MWKRILFKRRAPGNVTSLVVQRVSTEFRQLLLIIIILRENKISQAYELLRSNSTGCARDSSFSFKFT